MSIPTDLPGDPTADARAAAAQLFLAAARQEHGLTRMAQLDCLLAAETLDVTNVDATEMAQLRSASASTTTEQLIRDGLAVLGRLDLDLFADPRIMKAAGHAQWALGGTV